MDSMMDWKQQWEADQRAQQETLALLVQNDNAILQELADARTQREAMMTAQFEMKQHSDKQNEMILQLLTAFTQTVKRTTDGDRRSCRPGSCRVTRSDSTRRRSRAVRMLLCIAVCWGLTRRWS